MTISPRPPHEPKGSRYLHNYVTIMFCPGCGCQTSLHDAVIRMGNEVIAHCSSCGPCWKSVKTEFLETVVRRLGNEK